jgi:radical SAM protein with 4Fe4S-binding SPASM domain
MFTKVCTDLSAVDYNGSLTFSAYSEPFLHKQLFDFIRTAKKILPNCKVDMVSNGDLITDTKLQEAFDAGLHSINLSLYDGPQQFDEFNAMIERTGLKDKKIFLRRRFFQDGNYGLTVSSRGGEIDSNKFRSDKEEQVVELPLKRVCYYPFYMVLVDYTGDVMLCSHDWSKKLTFGNISTENILDIWQGKKLQGIRKSLSKANRNIFPCNKCDVHGDLIGKEHFDAWTALTPSAPLPLT